VKLAADAACSMTNLFQRGDVVVFRMWGVHVATGGNDLTNVSVKKAYVDVPGLPAIPMAYSTHPTKRRCRTGRPPGRWPRAIRSGS